VRGKQRKEVALTPSGHNYPHSSTGTTNKPHLPLLASPQPRSPCK
jgi:hypothetical protein